ncbi:hypothetical protein [Breznakiella homolactica]|uniref:Uncharacterized protein n=1 Tax=Breznakiella homolactica TaxID=2798577 RepID=A0A7T7XQZ1_9SPIR|nr:hypothetical protein [Breznakiella homolactica]QQO10870.1 hypothetical protein JFL75_08125 [Breznakiella homolactica]
MENGQPLQYLMEENTWRKNIFIEALLKICGALLYFLTAKQTHEDSFHYRILEYVFTNSKTVILDRKNRIFLIEEHDRKEEIKTEDIRTIILRRHAFFDWERFSIDIYDNALNAYECFDTYNYGRAEEAVKKIEESFDIPVADKTAVNGYEGFRKRIV